MPMFADAHISSLNYLCTDQKQSPRNRRKARWEDGNILLSAIKPKSFVWGDPPQGGTLSLPQFFTEKVPLICVNCKTRHFSPGGGEGGGGVLG